MILGGTYIYTINKILYVYANVYMLDYVVPVYLFVSQVLDVLAIYLRIRYVVQYLYLWNVKHVGSIRIPILYNVLNAR